MLRQARGDLDPGLPAEQQLDHDHVMPHAVDLAVPKMHTDLSEPMTSGQPTTRLVL